MWQTAEKYPAFTVTSSENAGKTGAKAEGFAAHGYSGGSLSKSLFPAAVSAALLFATAFTPGTAIAQVGPGAGSPPIVPITPSREELDRQRPDSQAPRSARLKIDGDIERAPCALDAPQYADIRTNITDVVFNNLQEVSAAELRASYASLLGQNKPISTLCTIRDAAATELRRRGYLAAVQVPVQRIENGVVKFEVLFAKIVAIRVRGDAGPAEGLLASYLGKLTEQKIFNRFLAERYLLLSRDVPGYNVRLSLKPAGTVPGELVGEVSVEHTPLDVNLAAQNFSSRSSGRWSGTLGVTAYGLLGGDRLTASVGSTFDAKEQQIAQIGYDTKLGGDGLTVSGNFTYAWSKPDVNLPGFTITARTLFATGEVRYPWIRTQGFSLVGAIGMDFLNQTVSLATAAIPKDALTRDKLRIGFLRLDMDAGDVNETRAPIWRASGSIEFRQGLNILNASPPSIARPGNALGPLTPSRFDGDRTSSLIRASASLEYSLGGGYWIAALPRAQYALSPLFGFEEYSTGNFSVGRGYDPGTTIGDSGLGSQFELRIPPKRPFAKIDLAVIPYVFTDVALTWDKLGGGRSDRDFLVSAGGGFRALLNQRFRIDGTVAFPLRKAGLQTHNHDPRFLVSLTSKLWPWDDQ